ncbi:benzaldehyde dehydrogenase [bacterium RCC_150]
MNTLLDPTSWSGRIFSQSWVPGGGGVRDVREPATGDKLGEVGIASAQDVADTARAALAAQTEWARRPFTDRVAVMRRAAQLFTDHADEIAEWLVRESGATRMFGLMQAKLAADECWEAAALASAPFGELYRTESPRMSLTRQVPVGVVGVIAPFNAPLALAIRAVAPALALGNSVVCKPDPRTAVSGGVVIARVFQEAGLPAGVFHMLPGGAETGAALVASPVIPVIAFTGSTSGGRAIARAAAEHLKRTHLELGGNSAYIVLDDADIEAAASAGAFGTFNHAGQICMAIGRHLVHESVADEYARLLAKHAERLPVGNPAADQVAFGPLIDEGQRDHVHKIVSDTVAAGATVLTGGNYQGLFYEPTVLHNVSASSRSFAEEVFGPVASVVSFSTLDEAVALASDSNYGLSLGIATRDVSIGLELAERIPTGMVHINDQTINDEPWVPFGGVNDSGTGSRHGGSANLAAFTETQWVTLRTEMPAYPF